MTTHESNPASVLSPRTLLLNGVAMTHFDQIRATSIVEAARRKVIASQ
jgi:hypothetical protein